MINSPTGLERFNVHGAGAQSETISLVQARDAAGYVKLFPVPATKVSMQGIVSPVMPQIYGLKSTDGLVGAKVSGGGLAPDTVVTGIVTTAVPGTQATEPVLGVVEISPQPPKPEKKADNPNPDAPVAPPVEAPPPAPVALEFYIPSQPITVGDGVSRLILNPREPIPELTVTLPKNPVDGQLAFIFSTLEIGALTVLANEGQTLAPVPNPDGKPMPLPSDVVATGGQVSARPADVKPAEVAQPKDANTPPKPPVVKVLINTGVGYLYSLSDTTWNRIQ